MKKVCKVLAIFFLVIGGIALIISFEHIEGVYFASMFLGAALMTGIAAAHLNNQELIVEAINKASDPYDFFANEFAIELGINHLKKLVREDVVVTKHEYARLDVESYHDREFKVTFKVGFSDKNNTDNSVPYSFVIACERAPQNISNWQIIESTAKIKEEFLKK